MPRQQTLRASVDWSHELLSDDERVLFRRMAVFAGGWTLDAVEEVCAGERLSGLAILDLLTSLVEKSLVGRRGARGERALPAAGDGSSVRARSSRTGGKRLPLCATATATSTSLWPSGSRLTSRPRTRARGLTCSTWRLPTSRRRSTMLADTDGERALRLCVALTVWWKLRGRFALADAAYVRALGAAPAGALAVAARVLWARGYLLVYSGRFDEAVASELEALEMARVARGDLDRRARARRARDNRSCIPDPGRRPRGARTGARSWHARAATSGASSTRRRSWRLRCDAGRSARRGRVRGGAGDHRAHRLRRVRRVALGRRRWRAAPASRAATRKRSRSTSERSVWQTRSASPSAPATHTHTGASCALSEATARQRWPTSVR